MSIAPSSPDSGGGFSSSIGSTGSTLGTGMHFSSGPDAFAVLVRRQSVSGTVFGHPTLRGLIIEKIEAQNADLNSSPFRVIRRPGEIPSTHWTLPVKEGATIDLDLSAKPAVIGREGKLRHLHLSPPWQTLSLNDGQPCDLDCRNSVNGPEPNGGNRAVLKRWTVSRGARR